MTHELKQIIAVAFSWQEKGIKSVLASVVCLEGSSYRRPGVRMLMNESGQAVGAVSGGCVEHEVLAQSLSVFKDGKPKMMTYDGRLRLGCEGIIYILIEPFDPIKELKVAFEKAIGDRQFINVKSYYQKAFGITEGIGTTIQIQKDSFSISKNNVLDLSIPSFEQTLPPLFQLFIFGAEHDAVQLSKVASYLGWDVTVFASANEQKSIEYFTGASRLLTPIYQDIDCTKIDAQTAIVLMTHSFTKDFQYLLALKNSKPAYFGILGPNHRRERLINQLLELDHGIDFEFINQLRGPAGIDIGAETPSEIALSILSEILSVIRETTPIVLKEKVGKIHG